MIFKDLLDKCKECIQLVYLKDLNKPLITLESSKGSINLLKAIYNLKLPLPSISLCPQGMLLLNWVLKDWVITLKVYSDKKYNINFFHSGLNSTWNLTLDLIEINKSLSSPYPVFVSKCKKLGISACSVLDPLVSKRCLLEEVIKTFLLNKKNGGLEKFLRSKNLSPHFYYKIDERIQSMEIVV